MTGVVAPYIEAARNLFAVENVSHLLVYLAADVVDSGGEDAGIAAVEVEVVGVLHVRHVMSGKAVVTVLIVVTGEEARWVEGSSHGKNLGEDGGMPEGEVDGMVAAKAATDCGQAGHPIAGADEGDNFVEEVLLVAEMPGDARAGNNRAVVPALCIDRIDAEELETAAFDLVLDRANHAKVFKIEETAAGSGKSERRDSGVSEDE